ncbi:MAG TPA: hypothetical protein VIO58_06150 [Candidatus Methanoperedens sp.]
MKSYMILMLVFTLSLFLVAGHAMEQIGGGQQMKDSERTPDTMIFVEPDASPVSTVPEGKIITLEDDRKTISLLVKETFLLKLGEEYDWNVTIDNQTVLSRVVGVLVVRGAQGIYRANSPGNATLTAVGDPVCRKAIPPCAAPSREFKLYMVIAEEPGATPTPAQTPKAAGFGWMASLAGVLASGFLARHRSK